MIILNNKDQKLLVKALAKETKCSESEILFFLVDMGITLLISSRRNSTEGGLETMITEMGKMIEENPVLLRMAQRLDLFHKAGAEG